MVEAKGERNMLRYANQFWGAFAKLRMATISFAMCVCLTVSPFARLLTPTE
jgi:heme/copper-type cytochrome/quinol oxidase subunit 4